MDVPAQHCKMDVMDVSVIVPTFNEAPNIGELVVRLEVALTGYNAEVVFVDDSTDDTANVINRAAAASTLPIRLIRREQPIGGLSGAVLEGLRSSTADWCVVMDGDLQHPAEVIPTLLSTGVEQEVDVVVASRHMRGGSSAGLNSPVRTLVSGASNVLTRAMFPLKLRNVSDPMTGFFAVRRNAVDLDGLQPRGFKILLELLARNSLSVAEEPFVFAERFAGKSKADIRQGIRFLTQLAALRFGRLSGFALIGAFGAVANLAIMAVLQASGIWYLAAAIISGIVTIIGNFLLQERFVFHDLRAEGRNVWLRFGQSLAFNGVETAVRLTLLYLIVEATVIPSVVAQAVLIALGFVLRFVYHSRVVYRPRPATTAALYDAQSFDVDSVSSD